jgi:hypothetical protein
LLENKRLIAQLCGLERRTARSGKDSIDHAQGRRGDPASAGHDDVCNSVAGAASLAIANVGVTVSPELLQRVAAMPVNPHRRHSAWRHVDRTAHRRHPDRNASSTCCRAAPSSHRARRSRTTSSSAMSSGWALPPHRFPDPASPSSHRAPVGNLIENGNQTCSATHAAERVRRRADVNVVAKLQKLRRPAPDHRSQGRAEIKIAGDETMHDLGLRPIESQRLNQSSFTRSQPVDADMEKNARMRRDQTRNRRLAALLPQMHHNSRTRFFGGARSPLIDRKNPSSDLDIGIANAAFRTTRQLSHDSPNHCGNNRSIASMMV